MVCPVKNATDKIVKLSRNLRTCSKHDTRPDDGLILGQCHKYDGPNIEPTLGHCIVLSGSTSYS